VGVRSVSDTECAIKLCLSLRGEDKDRSNGSSTQGHGGLMKEKLLQLELIYQCLINFPCCLFRFSCRNVVILCQWSVGSYLSISSQLRDLPPMGLV
jgi:hypothetical protein